MEQSERILFCYTMLPHEPAKAFMHVQIVSQSDALTDNKRLAFLHERLKDGENLPGRISFTVDGSGKTYVPALDLHDLVLTVTVESSPLDGVWVLTTPVPGNILTSMCHSEIATLVRMR